MGKNKNQLPKKPIGKTKAFKWASQLQQWDHKRFDEFNRSYFGNSRETVRKTHEALRKVLATPDMEKEEFAQLAYPNEKNPAGKLGQRLGYFMEALKKFLALEYFLGQLDADHDFQKLQFLKGLKDHSRNKPLYLNPTFWAEYTKDYKHLKKEFTDNFNLDLLLELESGYIRLKPNRPSPKHPHNSLTDQKITTLDHYYYLTRLRETCVLLSNKLLSDDAAYDPVLVGQTKGIRQVLELNPKLDFLGNIRTQVYERILDLLEKKVLAGDGKPFSSQEVNALSDMGLDNLELLEKDIYIYGLITNILVQQINSGLESFKKPYFYMTRHVLRKRKIIDENGKTVSYVLNNTAILGFQLGGVHEQTAEELLGELKKTIDLVDKDRRMFVDLCTGWKHFYRNNFLLAYKRLRDIRFSLPDWEVQTKELLFKCTFSNTWTGDAFSNPEMDHLKEFDDLKSWAGPNKGLTPSRLRNLKLKIHLYQFLVDLTSGDLPHAKRKNLLSKFKAELATAQLPFTELDWLREMLTHLKK